MGDAAQHPDLAQVGFSDLEGGIVDVVEEQDFVLDVEVQLAAQEAAQVLVDEVVEGITGGVVVQVLSSRVRLGFFSVGAGVLSSASQSSKPCWAKMVSTASWLSAACFFLPAGR